MNKAIIKFLCYFIPIKEKRNEIRAKFLGEIYTPKKTMRNQMVIPFYPVASSKLIQQNSKILIIAPHPDDEVIGCGGVIAKYHSQVDVLCINSSGVKYDWNTETAEEIAQIRCDEFYKTMQEAKINKCWIAKIWGVPPMFEGIKNNFENYLSQFNFNEYDFIFIPHQFDGHREHRFVGNYLIKKLLKKSGYKKSLKIARYEVWGTMQCPNYFEDITDYTQRKKQLINTYESRQKARYADKILALNYYRGITSFFQSPEKSAEAFYIQSVKEYLKELDDKSWSKPC